MNPLEIAQSIRPEITIFREAIRFTRKDPTKVKLVAGLYALSFLGPEVGHAGRLSYFALRHLDDLLDGEHFRVQNPRIYALDIKKQIETDSFDHNDPIAQLVARAVPILELKGENVDNPRSEFSRVIDAMILDHDRRIERRALSEKELLRHHANSIDPGTNLLLIGMGSSLRTTDIPEFGTALGRAYSLRDIEKDWKLGIINVPQELLDIVGANPNTPLQELMSDEVVQGWMFDEATEVSQQLVRTQQRIDRITEPWSRRVLSTFVSEAANAVNPMTSI